ncbi:vomeronasal type-2 receptor 26-like [Podarcis lilfordi]|uniref:Vomeronasal type-2 receptor 26-like n=1 Tax=Podarcis lilfordi TaxID=74358 RepID=A0AA35L6A7_9SAUR|nr:vomeronasal type-2 receptor 26-like [Podarcis lilfordi]
MNMSGHSYSLYNAIYAIVHALHGMLLPRTKYRAAVEGGMQEFQMLQSWQLHPFLRRVSFNNSAGETVSFGENREVEAGFDITNMVTFPNNSFVRVKVGRMDLEADPGQEFSIDDNRMVWHRSFQQVPPLSVCNPSCPPGSSKEKKEGEPFCCYDCAPCPQGKISSQKGVPSKICPEFHMNTTNLVILLLADLLLTSLLLLAKKTSQKGYLSINFLISLFCQRTISISWPWYLLSRRSMRTPRSYVISP